MTRWNSQQLGTYSIQKYHKHEFKKKASETSTKNHQENIISKSINIHQNNTAWALKITVNISPKYEVNRYFANSLLLNNFYWYKYKMWDSNGVL